MWTEFWTIVSNIASMCSIIALPIAIWQIFDLKTKVEATEEGIKTILEIKEHDKLNETRKLDESQYTEICGLLSLAGKSGKNNQNIVKTCQKINECISNCMVSIPPQYEEIMDSLKNAMENVEEYISSTPYDNTHLKDARDYLNNAMQGLKLEDLYCCRLDRGQRCSESTYNVE